MAITVVTAIGAAHEAPVAAALGQAAGVRLTRRCADVADLLAVCAAGRADIAVMSPDFPGLDRSAVAAMRRSGTGLIGVHRPGAAEEQQVLSQWGVTAQLAIDATPAEFGAAALAVAGSAPGAVPAADGDEPPSDAAAASLDDELAVLTGDGSPYVPRNPFLDPGPDPAAAPAPAPVVVVWGPGGAPGRTTLAVNLAAESARLGVPTVLVDADTHAACVAQHLALLDEAPGVAAATRLADAGHLDLRSLAAAAPEVSPGLRVLTGLPRADRWPEIRDDALTAVLEQCRQLARLVVVDVAAPLEDDEELSYDTAAPRRNAATLAALDVATTVLAVGSADPVGLQRLVRGLDDLRAVVPEPPLVVANRVRASAVGSDPEHRVAEALQRFAAVRVVRMIPDDRAACDGALLAGKVLAEHATGSAARKAIVALATELTGVTATSRRSWFAGRK
ncbi:AAA family ATPase [Flexivirga oryzae]|uniref:MinD-like ATPase involved in chromosome partitioning or flagellar assembly n=1 Tax=Flexivirga oryzae TaxID=1794944 RepID=A0A839N466_9MICO|nr:chromosome partitioning protein [Flexivirga oryzae]MBB2890763.1 MinD-like ATPase involved in chromosome partitioning or flagellar assembly [Flexivirga oryzae]